MRQRVGPFPQPGWRQRITVNSVAPLVDYYSGEISANVKTCPIGAVTHAARIVDYWLTVGASGKDDSNPLAISGELYINGTTCLSTLPSIAHVSGEASQHKTTKVTGDTGIAQAVFTSANTVSPGDLLSYDLTIERTNTPTTEISNVALVVELEPL